MSFFSQFVRFNPSGVELVMVEQGIPAMLFLQKEKKGDSKKR